MSDSVRPHRRQPTRLPHPWDSPGKNIGVGCHFLLQCMKVKSESEVTQLCLTLSDPMDCSLPGSSILYLCFIEYAKAFDCVDHNKPWKIFQEMGIPDHLTCLLRNLYADQEATVRTGCGTMDWVPNWERGKSRLYIVTCLFNLYAEYIVWNAKLDESQLE